MGARRYRPANPKFAARVVDARSKLATARALNPESAVSSLGHLLQLDTVDENELYAAMDWLLARQHGSEQRLANRHLNDNTLMLYDHFQLFRG